MATTSMPLRISDHKRISEPRPDTQPVQASFAGKTAIVTGSTSGIGLGIATAFAKAGMNVMLNGWAQRQTSTDAANAV